MARGRKAVSSLTALLAMSLTLFYSDIRDDMVDEVRRGQAEFAHDRRTPGDCADLSLWDNRFLGMMFPIPGTCSPRSWRVVPPVEHSPESRALLWISLVGAEDGIIHAQRGVTLVTQFHPHAPRCDPAQAMMAFDPAECTSVISKIFLNHPSTVDRLSLAVGTNHGERVILQSRGAVIGTRVPIRCRYRATGIESLSGSRNPRIPAQSRS